MYFEIQADDPQRAIQFYSDGLGWKFTEVPGLPIPYWRIEAEASGGGLLKRPAPAPPPRSGTNAFVCSFEVKKFRRNRRAHSSAWRHRRAAKVSCSRPMLARLLRRS